MSSSRDPDLSMFYDASALIVIQGARTVAVVGASPRQERHSDTRVEYLKTAGYGVVPVHRDAPEIAESPPIAAGP